MRMTGFKKLFVDMNVLIYATNTSSPWHLVATQSLQSAREANIELFVSPLVLREYLAVATRLNLTNSEFKLEQVWENVSAFQTGFIVLDAP